MPPALPAPKYDWHLPMCLSRMGAHRSGPHDPVRIDPVQLWAKGAAGRSRAAGSTSTSPTRGPFMPRQDPVCSLEVHDELKRDVETFRQSCTYIGTQEALDHLVELRLCVRCGSTLGIPIPASRSRAPGTRLRRDQVRPVVLIVDDDDAI